MIEHPHSRRPYRVVFSRPDDPRHATIVVSDAAAAHREARTIAGTGGHAEVHYVGPDGTRTTLATYPPRGPGPNSTGEPAPGDATA